MSKVVLSYVNPEQHKFTIDLHRQDGWFDTGIPVTADIMVLEFCIGEGPPTGGWIQARIGGNEILPRGDSPFHQQITLSTYLPGQDPDRTMADPTAQFLQMSGEAVQTLKLRIAGDNAPDEVRQVMIKIYVRPKDANQPQQFTAPQQREQTELAKWVKQ
jgi:hypothetical protein